MSRFKMSLSPIDPSRADGRARELLQSVKAKYGMVANLPRVMANSPAMMSTYQHAEEEFQNNSGFNRSEQEVIFLVISKENGCDYCVAAHSIMADMKSTVPAAVTNAIRDDQPIPDAKYAVLATFTRTMVEKRGWPEEADVAAFFSAGYTEHHILSIILAIAMKTMTNYTNHVFQTPLDKVFKAREYAPFKAAASLMQFVRKVAS
jgi:uncharacterized peroxidase-related enzyme